MGRDLAGQTFRKVRKQKAFRNGMATMSCHKIETFTNLAGVKRQIVNQVEGHSEICTKTRLAENLRRYANESKLDCCWVPETFVVSAGYNEGKLCVMSCCLSS